MRHLIRNAHSGSAPDEDALRDVLGPDDRVVSTGSIDEAEAAVARALADGVDAIVAVGGDGTLRTVARALAGHDDPPPLGLVPAGTGNDLARTLELPLDPREALAALDDAVPIPLDLLRSERLDGEPRGDLGLNAAVGGPPAASNEQLPQEVKQKLGRLAFLAAQAPATLDLRPRALSLTCDGRSERADLVGAVVANGRTVGGGVPVAPDADPTDGWLDLLLIHAGGPVGYAAIAAQLMARQPLDHALVERRRVRTVTFEPDDDLPFNLDGDLLTDGPVTFRADPGALTLLLPSDGPWAAATGPQEAP